MCALGAEPAGAAHAACESGGAGGAPRAPVQAGRLLLQPALIDSSALVYRGVAGLLSWQEGGGSRAESSAATTESSASPALGANLTKMNKLYLLKTPQTQTNSIKTHSHADTLSRSFSAFS